MSKGVGVLVLISLLVSGCDLVPGIQTAADPTPSNPLPPPTSEIQQPAVNLPETDQVVLTIPNSEPWSGREGDPRPNWLGWGAETFAAAPDRTFWIADTAVHPNRLLHYSPQGELLAALSLENQVVYVSYLAAIQDSLWLLD